MHVQMFVICFEFSVYVKPPIDHERHFLCHFTRAGMFSSAAYTS